MKMTVLLISKFKVLKNHADETDGSFMSETTFNKWLADKRTTPLDIVTGESLTFVQPLPTHAYCRVLRSRMIDEYIEH
eukprot:scaffold18465_cov175-Skeletonema_marinoi.AAC.1